jgi:hypothetical protein
LSTLALQAIEEFLMKPKHQEISHHSLSEMALCVLDDIRTFLRVPHIVQEIVSAEKTPTLSIVLPIYEKLIVMLKNLQAQLPEIAHAINASMEKLEEYLAYSRRTKIYALAMGILFFLVSVVLFIRRFHQSSTLPSSLNGLKIIGLQKNVPLQSGQSVMLYVSFLSSMSCT